MTVTGEKQSIIAANAQAVPAERRDAAFMSTKTPLTGRAVQ